jgi:hypothetical protein
MFFVVRGYFKPKITDLNTLKSPWKNDAAAEMNWPDSTSTIVCQYRGT